MRAHKHTHTLVDRFACESVSERARIDLKTRLERGKERRKCNSNKGKHGRSGAKRESVAGGSEAGRRDCVSDRDVSKNNTKNVAFYPEETLEAHDDAEAAWIW